MKRVTLENYQTDKYYPRIVRAVEVILSSKEFVAPIDLFVEMSLLEKEHLARWRKGQVPYLEKVIQCNLATASRILRIFRMHAHDLNLRPSLSVYMRHTKGPKTRLRFTKTCDLRLEEAYCRHFVRVLSKRKLRVKAENSQPQPQADEVSATESINP